MRRFYIFFCAGVLCVAALLASCNEDVDEVGTDTAPGWTVDVNRVKAAPQWAVADSTRSLFGTMSVIGAVPGVNENDDDNAGVADCVAFFSGEQCIGLASPKAMYGGRWLYMAKVYEPYDRSLPITMAYHQSATGLTWYWLNALDFAADDVVGRADSPFCPDMSKAQTYPLARPVQVALPEDVLMPLNPSDELAVFTTDGECRCVFPVKEFLLSSSSLLNGIIQLREQSVDCYLRYYSSERMQIFSSPVFSVTPGTEAMRLLGDEFLKF